MYFWNIKKLKAQLIERSLTERETLHYVIATTLIYTLFIELLSYSYLAATDEPTYFGTLDYISLMFVILITILGNLRLFKINNVNSENYFLQRYTALGWVVLMRVIVFIVLAMIVICMTFLLVGLTTAFNWESPYSRLSIFLFDILFYLFYYWYFGKHLADVAQKANYH